MQNVLKISPILQNMRNKLWITKKIELIINFAYSYFQNLI